MKITILAAMALLALNTMSCSNGNDMEDLSRLNLASKAYKQKLVKIINDRGDKLTFTFNKYLKIAGKDYLNVDINGHGGLHTNALIMVTNWTKLEGIKRTNGVGYRGAQLQNLKVSLINPDTNPVIVYQGLDNIAD